jgi:hypothetical protein
VDADHHVAGREPETRGDPRVDDLLDDLDLEVVVADTVLVNIWMLKML